jgi:hypothetical protein
MYWALHARPKELLAVSSWQKVSGLNTVLVLTLKIIALGMSANVKVCAEQATLLLVVDCTH